jgi:hypothetical protein
MNLLRAFPAGVACLLLAACAKTPPPITYYSEPPIGPATATIIGEATDAGEYYGKIISFPHSVDGDNIPKTAVKPPRDILLTAGLHSLTLGCNLNALYGSLSVPAEIKAGDRYLVKCERGDYRMLLDHPYAYVWLEDSTTGEHLTEKKVASLDLGGGAGVPIIIPIFHR